MDNELVTIDKKDITEVDKAGRPCKYESHVKPRLDEILNWLKEGMTEYSIADQLGIHQYTLIRYKDNYNELSEVYTRARKERNCLTMNSMYRRANGEKVQLKKFKVLSNGSTIPYTEEQYIPPDVNAADLYLRNNDSEYKSAKMDVGNGQITINNFQLEDWQSKRKQIMEEIRKLEMQSAVDLEPNE